MPHVLLIVGTQPTAGQNWRRVNRHGCVVLHLTACDSKVHGTYLHTGRKVSLGWRWFRRRFELVDVARENAERKRGCAEPSQGALL